MLSRPIPSPSALGSVGRLLVDSLRALRHSGFRIFWLALLVSNVGSAIQLLAIGVYVAETTGSEGWAGTVIGLQFVPFVVLSSLGGVLADRFERIHFLRVMYGLLLLQSLILSGLALSGHLSVAVLVVAALANGCTSALTLPATNAVIGTLLPRADLVAGMALRMMPLNLGRVVGPPIAAALLVTVGAGGAFAANAVCFSFVMVALWWLPCQRRVPTAERESIVVGLRRGLRAARDDREIRWGLIGAMCLHGLLGPFNGLVSVMAIVVLGGGAREASLLTTAQGLGAIVASLLGGFLATRFGERALLLRGWALLVGCAAAYWMAPSVEWAIALIFVLQGLFLTVNSVLAAIVLGRAPAGLEARISGLWFMAFHGAFSIGLIAEGWLADRFGMRAVGVGAVLLFAVPLLGALARRAARR